MNSKTRQVLRKIIEQPERSDIAWSDVESLFKALGAELTEGKGSRVRAALNGVKAVFHRPHPERVVNKPTVRAIRRFMAAAGVKNDGI
jgi:hypothetical protein